MKYSLNEYTSLMAGRDIRIEVYPKSEVAAKIVAAYEERAFSIVPLYSLISHETQGIPAPNLIIHILNDCSSKCSNGVVFIGLDAYLALLTQSQQDDFFRGLRNLLDLSQASARFLISTKYFVGSFFENPRYTDGLQLVEFDGEVPLEATLHIRLLPRKWAGKKANAETISETLKMLGDYIPCGTFLFSMEENYLPYADYGHIRVLRKPKLAMAELYSIDADIPENCAEYLLRECARDGFEPLQLLISRFGGEEYLTSEKAPLRLYERIKDELWDAYSWLLKAKLKQDSYLYQVLLNVKTSSEFLKCYIVDAAVSVLESVHVGKYAVERSRVLKGESVFEPLIAQFATATENDDRAVPFLNCGTDSEMKSLIRHAQKLEHTYGLPNVYQTVAPVLTCYLAPHFDYGDVKISEYFHQLRCFRMSDSISEEFVAEAYEAVIPQSIAKRDDMIAGFDDGATALLIVDGMGAEYYPLLLNLARLSALNVEEKRIVSVRLPSSTEFNRIKWSGERRLQEIKRADNISHVGYSSHEKCGFEENLAEIFGVFQKRVLPRIIDGLRQYKRVVVTADHGSSYLAVTAHKNGLDKTLPWDGNVDDWRYAVLDHEIETPDGLVSVYSAETQRFYYIVKGYNRLPKNGGKLYALHGGATLEEMLVPFVVFTNDAVIETKKEFAEEFIENDAFDIL